MCADHANHGKKFHSSAQCCSTAFLRGAPSYTAPTASRAVMTSLRPNLHAHIKGLLPAAFFRFLSAPASRSARAMSARPRVAAWCSGALPSRFCRLMLAPAASSTFTTARDASPALPKAAAWSGELPKEHSGSTAAPARRRASTTVTCPDSEASWRAVHPSSSRPSMSASPAARMAAIASRSPRLAAWWSGGDAGTRKPGGGPLPVDEAYWAAA